MILVMVSSSFIHKVMKSELPKDHEDFRPLHLSKSYRRNERMLLKASAKEGWFKESDKDQSSSWKV